MDSQWQNGVGIASPWCEPRLSQVSQLARVKNQKPFWKVFLRSGLTLKYFMKNTRDTCARNVLELHLLCEKSILQMSQPWYLRA